MAPDVRPAPPVTVAVPGQGDGGHDLLSAGRGVPVAPRRGRALVVGAAAALLLVAVAARAGGLPGEDAVPEPDDTVSLALLTTTASAAPVRGLSTPAFATLRVRVAVRNDSRSWVTLEDAALGPYRATGDGLGALAPGGLTSVPLERLVACGQDTPGAAAQLLTVDVLGSDGPSQVYLGLLEPAPVEPAAAGPSCAASRAS